MKTYIVEYKLDYDDDEAPYNYMPVDTTSVAEVEQALCNLLEYGAVKVSRIFGEL